MSQVFILIVGSIYTHKSLLMPFTSWESPSPQAYPGTPVMLGGTLKVSFVKTHFAEICGSLQ